MQNACMKDSERFYIRVSVLAQSMQACTAEESERTPPTRKHNVCITGSERVHTGCAIAGRIAAA